MKNKTIFFCKLKDKKHLFILRKYYDYLFVIYLLLFFFLKTAQ